MSEDEKSWSLAYSHFRRPHTSIIKLLACDIDICCSRLGNINILDLGCGTGNYAKSLSTITNNPIYCLDKSEHMLSFIAERYSLHPIKINCNKDFNISDIKFGYVYCINAIHYIADIEKLFSRISKMLDKKGQIFIATRTQESLKNQTLGLFFPDTIPEESSMLHSIDSIVTNLKLAGFQDITIDSLVVERELCVEPFEFKSYFALQRISDNSFLEGLEKLKSAINLRKEKYRTYYTIVRGKLCYD